MARARLQDGRHEIARTCDQSIGAGNILGDAPTFAIEMGQEQTAGGFAEFARPLEERHSSCEVLLQPVAFGVVLAKAGARRSLSEVTRSLKQRAPQRDLTITDGVG